jgi:hypothetical protein
MLFLKKTTQEKTMSITVPDHDTLIKHIQNYVIEAVSKEGWPMLRELCEVYDVSHPVLRKIYFWEPKDHTSFNFQKLINAYDLAYDLVHGMKAKSNAS